MTGPTYVALHFAFHVRCGDDGIGRWVRSAFSPLASDRASGTVRYDVSGSDDDCRLDAPDGSVLTGTQAGVVDALVNDVRRRALQTAGETAVLHAAAVARDDRLVLLPGSPGAGKSSLACALVRRGWAYLGDEMVGVDLDGALLPCPTPPRLGVRARQLLGLAGALDGRVDEGPDGRVDGFGGARDDGLDDGGGPADGKAFVALQSPAGAGPGRHGGRVTDVVCPSFDPDGPTALQPATPGTALALLAEQTFPYSPRHGLSRLRRLVEPARCWSLPYSDLDEAARLVETA